VAGGRELKVNNMSGRFADNPAYVQYETLLKQLHGLIAAGRGESHEAEAVRDAMDEPGGGLSREEVLRLKGLSADLYMLQGTEVFAADKAQKLELEELRSELDHLRQWNSWDSVLALLRRRAPTTPENAVAATRARAYAELGHADTALLFLDYAFKATPYDSGYRALRLMLLLDAGCHDEAVRTAEAVLTSKDVSPDLAVASADVLFANAIAQGSNGKGGDRLYARVLEGLDRFIGGKYPANQVLPSFLVLAHLLRAACLHHFGKVNEALRACDEALRIAPNDEVVSTVRSQLQTKPGDGALRSALNPALDRFKASVWKGPALSAA
jgi:tetratricopeptide (TPR) repeat protein